MKQMEKVNEVVVVRNNFIVNGGGKRLVCPFKRQEFWKRIGCILLEVTDGKKGNTIWSEIPKASCSMAPTKSRRDVYGNTNLYKVCCDNYRNLYIYACH